VPTAKTRSRTQDRSVEPRRYDSPVRRQRALETRERIVEAGCKILRKSSIRDWRALTLRGVAEEAGVNERTVYRYFGNERGLRDAVMNRLEEKSGIELDGMRLDDVAGIAARIFAHVSAYPARHKPPLDPTLTDANRRQRDALFAALAEDTADWLASERASAAALLDVLWSVATYERLVSDWGMDRDDAIGTVTWAIGLVEDAIREGRRPT
jgi:AcrR family transcriptional regulator